MQRKYYVPKKMENLFFQPQMDESNFVGGDQELRTSTLIRHRPIQGESNIDFLGESEGSLPPPHDSFPDASEAINDFWSMSGNFILIAGRMWKEDILVADLDDPEKLAASEIRARRLNATEVLTSKTVNMLYSLSQMEQSNYLAEIRSENIHFNPGSSRTRRRTR